MCLSVATTSESIGLSVMKKLSRAILEKEIAFWDRVKNLNPPEATSVSDVSLMFEKDAGTSIEADGKALALFNDLRDMKSRRKSLEEEIAISEEKLKMYMQEHSVLTPTESRSAHGNLRSATDSTRSYSSQYTLSYSKNSKQQRHNASSE